jgi:hypothetical protein
MLVLSFRDMSVPRCGAVTSGYFYRLPGVTPHIAWDPAPTLTLESWFNAGALLEGKRVCFLVHGFNVNRDFGYTGLGAVSQEMTPHCGALSMVAPPADLDVSGIDILVPVLWAGDWYLPINYPFLLPDIRLTGRYFAELILSPSINPASVSFITHSMGARVVLETVQQTMAMAGIRKTPIFDTCLFTAPAVSDQVFDDPDYAQAVAAVRRFVVVSSPADTTLSGAFVWGNGVEQALWPRDPGADIALGLTGPRLHKNSAALGKTQWYEIPATIGQNHSDYLPRPLAPPPPPVLPNGWFEKSINIGRLAKAVLERRTPPPPCPPASPVLPYV